MRIRPLLAAALTMVVAGCVPAASPPPAAPPPRARPVPTPVAQPSRPAPPARSDWRDWPLTAGDWRHGGGQASFGTTGGALLILGCERGERRMRITVNGAGAPAMTLRTSSTSRTLTASARSGAIDATLPVTDPLLDAIGFSRGRFVVERAGAAPLVVPAYAEILRVIEECRG